MKRRIAVLLLLSSLLLLLPSCQKKAETISIATKPMTEQYILGELISQLITAQTDYEVQITKGVGGGTSNIHPALVKGDFDLYAEYTGTAWSNVLKRTDSIGQETLPETLKSEYEKQYGLTWLTMFGFNNTYALAVRKEVADQYGIENCSELAKVAPDLTFGGNYDFFERADGYNAMCAAYGLDFGSEVDLDMGLKYQALLSGNVDVINAFTTDAQISDKNIVPLEDDRSFFPSYYCGIVVRQDTLERCDKLAAVLSELEGKITDEQMSAMNHRVEVDGINEADVARDFLVEQGLLSDG